MASKNLTKTQVMTHLKSLVKVPRFVCIVTVDGVPFHVAMFAAAEDATEWAAAEDLRTLYLPMSKEGQGHYIRMTLHVVADDPTPGLPAMVASFADSILTWDMGKRTDDIKPVRRAPSAPDEEQAETPAPKPVAKKVAAKTTSAKKTTTAKTTAKKAAPRGGAGPRKTTAKKPVARKPVRRSK